ncbi:MAG: hypothetical protein Q7S51_11955, partial [Gallionellaceae bacterium]|nr:hypothetical protein [Gallionellaceae bacterium]
ANVVAIAAGEHSLAIKSDGTVWAWGWNTYGQLGNCTTINSATPVQVNGFTGAISVAGGTNHSLGIGNYVPSCPPTADAGTDQTVDEGTSVQLSGSGTDPNGSTVSYNWTQTAGTTVTLNGATTATPSFTAPQVIDDSIFTFKLTVTSQGGSSSDYVNVTAKDLSPTVTTTGVSNIQAITATLNGTVNTHGDSGGVYSQCKTGTGGYAAFGATLLPQPANGAVSVALSGLAPSTTYYCHLSAFENHTNKPDVDGLPDVSFTTLAVVPPDAITGKATPVAKTTATLNGTCNFKGVSGTAVFEYWKSAKKPVVMTTTTQYFAASSATYSVTQGITGLSSATSYLFRIKCTNAGGTSTGLSASFKTTR